MDIEDVGLVGAFMVRPPRKWLLLNGQSVLQSKYPELTRVAPPEWKEAALLMLPDLAGLGLIGAGEYDGWTYVLRVTGGERTVWMNVDEMPEHTHTANPEAEEVALSPGSGVYGLKPGGGENSSFESEDQGQGDDHNNMPPYVVVNWCIYAGR